jgi:hypothetical protein
MMRLRQTLIPAALLLVITNTASAYEIDVHDPMTRKTFQRLQLDFVARLGVPRGYVISDASLEDWMAEGARNEDRVAPELRPIHHFLDPIHDGKGLRVPLSCGSVQVAADDWALEPAGVTGNFYSLPQVKPVYISALLGPNPGSRDVYLRDFFLGMGHLVHLIQDMAQPEHTRNDQHLTYTNRFLYNGTNASIWEVWCSKNISDLKKSLVDYDGYATVKLPDYESYFHTNDKSGDRPAGKGLADYSNLNFVTQDTNYQDEDPFWACPPIQ